ncbi:MAG: SAM-dependent methyltransferase [Acholeplasmatales bacterium]|nr:SAM-dependent methyltransferase [Acholeplasmatales bacterium]
MMDINIPNNIIKGIISGKKKESKYVKGVIKRIDINGKEVLQVTLYTEKQAFHHNLDDSEFKAFIADMLENNFNNLELTTSEYNYSYRITSKGKLLSNRKLNKEFVNVEIEHNRKKNYLIEEGMIVPPLVDLGVMTDSGKVVKASYDKFKQINRFLEIINDSISGEEELKIIDFGCGKSYLTFILYYYYLVNIRKIKCNIIGLDLKEDVIDNCNEIAKKYNYNNLTFYKGDIAKYKDSSVDMIITLHACDTATDYALYHAINMKCKYIFSVPCCQHEINNQLSSDKFHLFNKFGILKDRFSAIVTDSIRANILQYYGYKTQIMEFIDFAHTPKNLLIRAQLTNNKYNKKIKEEVDALLKELDVKQTLYELTLKNED